MLYLYKMVTSSTVKREINGLMLRRAARRRKDLQRVEALSGRAFVFDPKVETNFSYVSHPPLSSGRSS